MNNYFRNDTIVAISTPVGTGGIGVVRISGVDSLKVIEKIFTTTLKKRSFLSLRLTGFITGGCVMSLTPLMRLFCFVLKHRTVLRGKMFLKFNATGA